MAFSSEPRRDRAGGLRASVARGVVVRVAGRGQGGVAHLVCVTVSMRVMSAGDGYRYLLRSVAAGDGARSLLTPLTRYYAEAGTPPGRWLGAGVADLRGSDVTVGAVVSEEQLRRLVGEGRDPSSGVPLGRPYRLFVSAADRVAARAAALDPDLPAIERAPVVARIEAEEAAQGRRRAVAGFDFTFSVPKSASILWAVGDERVRGVIEAAHHAAVADVVGFMEREVASTRMGASDGTGAVVQADVTGLVATAFGHFDSRAGDPHLHTHVVIANKVRTVVDGEWRSLDGRPLHAAVVALSELHEGLVMDRVTRELGVGWESRAQGRDRNPSWAIETVPADLEALFSSRSRDIDGATDLLVSGYVAVRGHRPSKATLMKLRAEATLSTRPEKQVRSLSDLTAGWRARAGEALGLDAVEWVSAVLARRQGGVRVRVGDVPPAVVEEWGRRVVAVVGEQRSTWRHWNLVAEAARQTMGWRFATAADREAVTAGIVEAAEASSVMLTPPEVASSPTRFRRPDGTSRFRPRYSTVYSSEALLAAEARLLEAGRDEIGPRVPEVVVRQHTRRSVLGRRPGADQAAAVEQIATSGRVLDVLVGPAGAGKTTAMRTLRTAWEAAHGAGSVIGLAPSAAAAEVLADDLGIGTENTAKWLHDQHADTGAPLKLGQLMIVDEASLAGTTTLDRITALVKGAGAKLLLVGDQAQLQAVDAGGAFGLLAADRGDPPELTDVRRFVSGWEKAASLQLRNGDAAVLDVYAEHDRIRGGDLDAVTGRALAAWRADLAAGRTSVLIADTSDTVRDLNARARAARILDGSVHPDSAVPLHDGAEVSTGDVVISRRNDRRLLAGRRWVRNGDRWLVLSTGRDGSLTVRRADRRWGSRVRLPVEYVAADVELGYAVTTHRAQGSTVDTGHAVIAVGGTREAAYVAMTRGRLANTAYVATDPPADDHITASPAPGQRDPAVAALAVLTGVLGRVSAEVSAHETMRQQQDAAASIRVLAAEYDTIATAAQHDRWVALIRASCLTAGQADAAVASEAFGPLAHTLRLIEAHRHDVARFLDRVITARTLEAADDVAAVLDARLLRLAAHLGPRARAMPRLIVGLVPQAAGPMPADMAGALRERSELMEARARTLAADAVAVHAPWVRELGPRPADAAAAVVWERQVQTVAAYRDRYAITGDASISGVAVSTSQQRDAAIAAAAIGLARRAAQPRLAPRSAPEGPRPTWTGLSR